MTLPYLAGDKWRDIISGSPHRGGTLAVTALHKEVGQALGPQRLRPPRPVLLLLLWRAGATPHCGVGASLVAEHRLWGMQASVAAARGLSSWGSRALRHRLSSWGSWSLKHRLHSPGSWALRHRFSSWGSWALRHRLSSWGSWSLKHRLRSPGSWALRHRLSSRSSWA